MSLFCRIGLLLLCALLPAGAWTQQAVQREPVLLIAAPELRDPNFAQTVVLVVFPPTAGPTGVILNRPTRLAVKEAFPEEPRLKASADPLYFGGPVRPTGLMFLFRHATAPQNALPVVDDLYLSSDPTMLDQLLGASNHRVQRYFVGYSGWAPVQLDVEIAEGAWYVLPADLEVILQMDVRTMWRDLLLRATAVRT